MAFNTFRPGISKQPDQAAPKAADDVKAAPRFGFRPGAAPKPAAEITPDDIPDHLRTDIVEKPAPKMGFRRR